MMISVSMLSSYMYCPRKIYVQKVLGMLEPGEVVVLQAKMRHKVHEMLNKGEEYIISKLTADMDISRIRKRYWSGCSLMIKTVVGENLPKLQELGLSTISVTRRLQSELEAEIRLRAENTRIFMEKSQVSGRDLWHALVPKIKSEYHLESESLGLYGHADEIEI